MRRKDKKERQGVVGAQGEKVRTVKKGSLFGQRSRNVTCNEK